ncbi:MAG: phosphotransferase [Anaerolineae bacterium]
MAAVRRVKWAINGQQYDQTLDELIAQATALLLPAQAGASIIGHGDAHNGNVFFRGDAPLTYFDPAFAGRHSPLLDLTKPLFHNVFAMWMYFPQVKAAQTHITLKRDGGAWHVEHDYTLHPIRNMFLTSKVERALIPILRALQSRGWLRPDWRAYLKAALFCCPLLTMNLTDGEKFPPEISLLGLAMAVEMGGESAGARSLIDRTLDEVEAQLNRQG